MALLRIREARIKKELEDSRAQADAALRENKLASLRLKTEILRLGSSLSRSRPSSPARSMQRATDRQRQAIEAEEEAQRVEMARLAALKRIAEQKRREKMQKQEQERVAELEARRRFQKRDEKVGIHSRMV